MSHALGAIRFHDGTIRYYEYNGTSDVVISHHYETADEVWSNWRDHEWLSCQCDNDESVSIYTSYGGGFYLEGTSCRICGSVQSNEPDFDIIEPHETDDWARDLSQFE